MLKLALTATGSGSVSQSYSALSSFSSTWVTRNSYKCSSLDAVSSNWHLLLSLSSTAWQLSHSFLMVQMVQAHTKVKIILTRVSLLSAGILQLSALSSRHWPSHRCTTQACHPSSSSLNRATRRSSRHPSTLLRSSWSRSLSWSHFLVPSTSVMTVPTSLSSTSTTGMVLSSRMVLSNLDLLPSSATWSDFCHPSTFSVVFPSTPRQWRWTSWNSSPRARETRCGSGLSLTYSASSQHWS